MTAFSNVVLFAAAAIVIAVRWFRFKHRPWEWLSVKSVRPQPGPEEEHLHD